MFQTLHITGIRLILALSLLLAASFGSAIADECAETQLKLQKEQAIILERESELSEKVNANRERVEKFEQDELERLIERHHASIEAFNSKLDTFRKRCGKRLSKKTKPAATTKTVTSKMVQPAKVITPKTGLSSETKVVTTTTAKGANPADEVAASDALIKTLKGYYIQTGAFKNTTIAEHFQKRLEKRGFTPIMIARPYVHAVWVGPYNNYKEAIEAKESLLSKHRIDGYIIRFK